MGSGTKTVVWFRRDLRIEDNPALAAAARDGCVLPVFIWCPGEEGQFYPGRVSRWWLKQSLIHLEQSLRSLGTSLVFIRAESTLAALLQCIDAIGATRLVYNHLYELICIYITTFHLICSDVSGMEKVQGCSIEELVLENETEKLSNALLSRVWSPGWSNADKVLSEFINGHLVDYSENRMKVEDTTTSLLSPYIHFGELSVRKIYQNVRIKQLQWTKDEDCKKEESMNLFLRSIGLRDYSRYLCFNFPFTHERSLLGNLKHYPWRVDEGQFKSWRQGRTGYPLVDAGMRELWATGWLHNRTRVIVSSFLVKFLQLPWTWGMKYFWDTLLDADLESDILGWQYVSGSLPDGHELKRMDNPEVQGQKYNPDGEYIRNWIPELARVPTEWIHHPWDAPMAVLKSAGIELGLNYPRPIVDINTAMERLDDAVGRMWELDRAAKVAQSSNSDEVVADNLISINSLDIPKVIVKKEVTCDYSSLDQRVPSYNIKDSSEKEVNVLNGERSNPIALCSQVDAAKSKDVDLISTAESSSARKRSISESRCAVPTHFGTPVGYPLQQHDSVDQHHSEKSNSHNPAYQILDEKEEHCDAESSFHGFRPCKRLP
ncbi:hypothetical protein ZIOFF_036204 [Zingiber officinale]|uniref:Photolyase/cryptochrome alpha/beta domain-containing protein n=1 Tax=Zingiber officinale TaxID=94328 RepID=A0A8J5G9T0_ZINOF|nr:hypothetical protein ZIOFF_036204 [Zingiber officinale]